MCVLQERVTDNVSTMCSVRVMAAGDQNRKNASAVAAKRIQGPCEPAREQRHSSFVHVILTFGAAFTFGRQRGYQILFFNFYIYMISIPCMGAHNDTVHRQPEGGREHVDHKLKQMRSKRRDTYLQVQPSVRQRII